MSARARQGEAVRVWRNPYNFKTYFSINQPEDDSDAICLGELRSEYHEVDPVSKQVLYSKIYFIDLKKKGMHSLAFPIGEGIIIQNDGQPG